MTKWSTDEIRIVALSAPLLIKMLKDREERCIARMYGEFRNGKVEQLPNLAELSCIRDIVHEIETAQRALAKEKA